MINLIRNMRRLCFTILIIMSIALMIACDGPKSPEISQQQIASPSPSPEPTNEPYEPNRFSDFLGVVTQSENGFTLVAGESKAIYYEIDDRWNVTSDYYTQVGGDTSTIIISGYFLHSGRLLVCRLKLQEIQIDRCPQPRG
ncbi:hypothetical protein KBD09_03635 [Candidatus Woesebacteria bacterium]|nr:hypothetical protein [Candidatus Woesebacteria bacterium]